MTNNNNKLLFFVEKNLKKSDQIDFAPQSIRMFIK